MQKNTKTLRKVMTNRRPERRRTAAQSATTTTTEAGIGRVGREGESEVKPGCGEALEAGEKPPTTAVLGQQLQGDGYREGEMLANGVVDSPRARPSLEDGLSAEVPEGGNVTGSINGCLASTQGQSSKAEESLVSEDSDSMGLTQALRRLDSQRLLKAEEEATSAPMPNEAEQAAPSPTLSAEDAANSSIQIPVKTGGLIHDD